MKFLTLEEAKAGFEVGSIGNFLLKFEPTSVTNADIKANIAEFSIVANKYLPATSVTYKMLGQQSTNITLGANTITIPSQITLADSISIETLETIKEEVYNAFDMWYKNTTLYKTGRVPRNLAKNALLLRVYHFDRASTGQDLVRVSKDSFIVNIPEELQKSNTQGMSIKTRSLTFKIIGKL